MIAFLQYDFMIRAIEAGMVLAVVAPTIGIFFVVRRYSAMADALSHVSLAGVAGGLFLGVSTIWAALIACVLAIFGIERLREQRALSSDMAVSLFLFGGLALGVVLIGFRPAGGVNVSNYLFGSILTVSQNDVLQIAVIGAVTLVFTAFFWRSFYSISLDEDVAQATGLSVRRLNRLLSVLGAATIAISINVVGVLLIGALMVIPVLAAMQFRMGFKETWYVAVMISLLSVLTGLILSFLWNSASGATIVLCAVAFFLITFVFSQLRTTNKNVPA